MHLSRVHGQLTHVKLGVAPLFDQLVHRLARVTAAGQAGQGAGRARGRQGRGASGSSHATLCQVLLCMEASTGDRGAVPCSLAETFGGSSPWQQTVETTPPRHHATTPPPHHCHPGCKQETAGPAYE